MNTMHRLYITLLILAATVCSALGAPLTPAQQQDVIARINRTAAATSQLNCGFTQVKHLKMLNDRLEAKGRMFYSRPNRLRWEYSTPYQYLFILNDNRVYVGSHGRHDVIDTRQNKIFKEIARIMMSTVTGTALSNAKDFDVRVADGRQVWEVTMTPRKSNLKKMFRTVELRFGKSNLLIQGLTINERNGDRTVIDFNNQSTTAPVNANLFAVPAR